MSKAVKNLVRQARGVVEQIHEIEMGERQSPYHPNAGPEVAEWRATAVLLVPHSSLDFPGVLVGIAKGRGLVAVPRHVVLIISLRIEMVVSLSPPLATINGDAVARLLLWLLRIGPMFEHVRRRKKKILQDEEGRSLPNER